MKANRKQTTVKLTASKISTGVMVRVVTCRKVSVRKCRHRSAFGFVFKVWFSLMKFSRSEGNFLSML